MGNVRKCVSIKTIKDIEGMFSRNQPSKLFLKYLLLGLDCLYLGLKYDWNLNAETSVCSKYHVVNELNIKKVKWVLLN